MMRGMTTRKMKMMMMMKNRLVLDTCECLLVGMQIVWMLMVGLALVRLEHDMLHENFERPYV